MYRVWFDYLQYLYIFIAKNNVFPTTMHAISGQVLIQGHSAHDVTLTAEMSICKHVSVSHQQYSMFAKNP